MTQTTARRWQSAGAATTDDDDYADRGSGTGRSTTGQWSEGEDQEDGSRVEIYVFFRRVFREKE